MKETYKNIQLLLKHIQYSRYSWNICGNLKVVAILLGLQLVVFFASGTAHYVMKDWPLHRKLVPGQKNVVHDLLVDPKNIFLPPLHIKLEVNKNFVIALNKQSEAFAYL